ncbi:MAG: BTAD domain-containing putative transcriptional regulator [Chloroflexota bacterium]
MKNPNVDLPTNARLIVIHPQIPNPRAYIAQAITKPYTHYHRFTGTDLALSEVTAQLANTYISGETSNCLILDECDRLQPTALNALVTTLHADFFITQIMILSRQLPTILFENDRLQPTTHVIQPDSFTPPETAQPQIEAYAFGIGTLWLNGKQITFSSDAQHEFVFYVLEQDTFLREDALTNLSSLQSLPYSEASSQFNSLRASTRELLGIDWLVQTGTLYRRNPAISVYYDVQRYRELVSAENLPINSDFSKNYQQAFRLFRNPFLSSFDAPWVLSSRSMLHFEHASICTYLAKQALNESEVLKALNLYIHGLKSQPFREDIVETVMCYYIKLNMPCDALAVANALRDNRTNAQINTLLSRKLQQLIDKATKQCPEPPASP